MADYANGKSLSNRLYVDTNPLYVDTNLENGQTVSNDIPEEFGQVMSDLIAEANGDKKDFLIQDKDLLDMYNRSLDETTKEQADTYINNAVVALAERGAPADKVVEWANKQKKALYPALNSGAYTQVKDQRLLKAAEEDPVIKSLLLGGDETLLETARSLDKFNTGLANYQIIYNKMVEANNTFDEQNILTKAGKGLASFALMPFVDNINARRVSGELKDIFGEDFGNNWNVNTLYEKTREKLLNLSTQLNENDFKHVVNTIDEALLGLTGYTYGDRSTFWRNIYDQNYRLNNLILGGEALFLAPQLKGLTKAGSLAAKVGGKKAALQAVSYGALQEVLPGSGIAAMTLAKVAKSPVKFLATKGQRKMAAEIASKGFLDSEFMDMAKYSKDFNLMGREAMTSASRSVLEETGSGLSKPFIADAAVDISKTDAMRTAEAMVSSPNGIDLGLQKAAELTAQIKSSNPLWVATHKVKNQTEEKFILDVLGNLDSQSKFVRSVTSKNDKDGLVTILELGRADSNQGFKSIEDAKSFAKNLSITSDDFLGYKVVSTKPKIVSRGDGYFVQLERTYQMNDDALATLGDLTATNIKKEFDAGVRTEYSGNNILRKIATNTVIPHYIRTLNNAYQMAEGRTLELLQGQLKQVKAGSGPVLDMLLDVTRSRGAWINSKSLVEKGVPEKVINAYEKLRLVEDTSRMLDGQIILRDLEEMGMKNVYSASQRIGLGRVAQNYDAKKVNMLVGMDESTGALQTAPFKNTPDFKKNYTVYEMQRAINGSRYIAINNKTIGETPVTWSNTFLSYKPARKTFSQGSGFVKQAKLTRDKGKVVDIDEIHTIFSHPNQDSVKRATNLLEEARQIAIRVDQKEIDMAQAERLFGQLPDRELLKYSSFDSFYQHCGKDKLISLDPEAKLVYVPDGGKLPEVIAGISTKDYNRPGISMMEFSNSERIIKQTQRKDATILNPFTLDEAPRVSIDEELGLEVKRILNSSTVTDYTRLFADDFADTFRPFIKDEDPVVALMDTTLPKKIQDRTTRNMMENAQQTFARMKSQPTEFDVFMEDTARWTANWIAPGWKSPEGSNRLWLYKKLTHASPTKVLRAYGFHFNLGMWNPRQFYAQAAASVNAAELSPKAAAQITPMYMPIVGYMKSGDKSLRYRIAKSFGVKEDYIEELVEGAKRLDIWSKGSFGGAYDVAERGKGLWDDISSTWFYDSGEHVNRLYTGLLTVQEQLNKGIKVTEMSNEQILQLINRQQNLYMNMSRAGSSELQRGALGVITQFRGYQMRALELMFDKTLTAGERLRFGLATAVLGGTKGLLGRKHAAMIHSYLEDKFDIPDYASQAVYNGALDQMVLDMGGNVSIGEFFNVSFGDLIDLAVETNPPSYSAVGKTIGGLGTIFNGIARYGRGGESTPSAYVATLNTIADMARKGQLPGGPKNAILGLWAYKTGERLNAQGALTDKDLSAFDSAMITLGFRDPHRDLEALAYQKIGNVKDKEEDYVKQLNELFVMAVKAPNDEMRQAYSHAAHTIMSDLREENPLLIDRVLRQLKDNKFNLDATERALEMMLQTTGTKHGLDEFTKEWEQSNERVKEK